MPPPSETIAPRKRGRPKGSGTKVKNATVSPKAKASSKAKGLTRQGQNQMVTFIRDPKSLFTYWEVSPERIEHARTELGSDFDAGTRVLRVYRLGPSGEEILLEETSVPLDEMNRYVRLGESGGSYFLEVGQKTSSGRYFTLVRSNRVSTSFGTLSAHSDPQWEAPSGILEDFSGELIEETFIPGKKVFSADSGPSADRIGRKGKGRHSASQL